MSSISRTNGAVATIVSARSSSSNVNPAPSAPGMARTAYAATRVSNSSNCSRFVSRAALDARAYPPPGELADIGGHRLGCGQPLAPRALSGRFLFA